ncbi:MAG: hypothetical protein KKC26_01930, partial [Nanoarchaeota archaeon]|nr:hypothetical protein [Nanoarchaeota archaeon]MBU1849662.1 hypothetical protein [Nanoarchaeota archaeon]
MILTITTITCLTAIVIICVGVMMINQFVPGYPSSSCPDSKRDYYKEALEKKYEEQCRNKYLIDLKEQSLDKLRVLDKLYAGTKKGDIIHEYRRERILELRDEKRQEQRDDRKKIELYEVLKKTVVKLKPEKIPLSDLERV